MEEKTVMPELCRFLGLIIKIQFRDHSPPHIRVWYGGHDRASIRIKDGSIYRGSLPRPQLLFVGAWAYLHQDELMEAWDMASRNRHPGRIAPLE